MYIIIIINNNSANIITIIYLIYYYYYNKNNTNDEISTRPRHTNEKSVIKLLLLAVASFLSLMLL